MDTRSKTKTKLLLKQSKQTVHVQNQPLPVINFQKNKKRHISFKVETVVHPKKNYIVTIPIPSTIPIIIPE